MDHNEKLIRNLREIGHTMRHLSEGKAGQKRILILLLQEGDMTQRKLTQILNVQPGTVSEVLAKLEDSSLICRKCSEDRRTADIFLTAEGRQQAILALEARTQRHQEMFACLSDSEKEQLLTLLEKVNHDWDKRYREVK